jgi:1-aminocyclopropane-1-carboxylate deaminase/D-cysteine desulfhydrase-like pyridoxal-dependent ACC family enzyme
VDIQENVAYVEWEKGNHTSHKLGGNKIELIPAIILECSERDKNKSLEFTASQNNPISQFNMVCWLSGIMTIQNSEEIILNGIEKCMTTGNLSLLHILPGYSKPILSKIRK